MRRILTLSVLSLVVTALLSECATQRYQQAAAVHIPEVTILSNRDYFPVVHELFQAAEDSIRVMMYSARYYTEKPSFAADIEHLPGTPWSNTNILLDDLVSAQSHGVNVQIIMDTSDWNRSNTEGNKDFGQRLIQGGVAVYMDDPEVTTHTKLILVDGDITVVGSTNWSYYALDSNNETSVLIRSQEVNRNYQEFFSEILSNSTQLTQSDEE